MPTDIGYTGQRLDAGTGGLMYYGARYYLPGTGRFVSADTVVPGAGNPQAFNRYSYTLNNPVRYTDPSGHCVFGLDTIVCIGVAAVAGLIVGVVTYNEVVPATQRGQPSIENNPNGSGCTASLTSCYEQGTLSDLASGQVGEEEFYELLETVATDFEEGAALPTAPGGYISGRTTFDTPFYNGGGRGGSQDPDYDSNQTVCIGDQGCWGRTEINYFAQGMWSAEAGESLEDALWYTDAWNFSSYFDSSSEGKLYWTKYGYLWHQNWLKWGDDWREHWEPPVPDDGVTPQ
jgi:RHS repeat-associated protein